MLSLLETQQLLESWFSRQDEVDYFRREHPQRLAELRRLLAQSKALVAEHRSLTRRHSLLLRGYFDAVSTSKD